MNELFVWLKSGRPVASIIIIVIACLIWAALGKAFDKGIAYAESRDGRRNNTARATRRIVKYSIALIVLLALFQANGINVTSLITSLGIAGAVVGFAAQEFIRDLFMGLHITTDDFFKVGDVIKYGDHIGVVKKFTLHSTQIEDLYTKNIISISNRNLDATEVVSGQINLYIGLSYTEDFEKIHKVMQALAEQLPQRIEGVSDAIYKGTSEFSDSNIKYLLTVIMDPRQIPLLSVRTMTEIQREFRKAGIEIPYPQLDVHLDGAINQTSQG